MYDQLVRETIGSHVYTQQVINDTSIHTRVHVEVSAGPLRS
jgi:hypothetical protein